MLVAPVQKGATSSPHGSAHRSVNFPTCSEGVLLDELPTTECTEQRTPSREVRRTAPWLNG
eukprot:14264133-Alexandrium_andersonii.AAC.1